MNSSRHRLAVLLPWLLGLALAVSACGGLPITPTVQLSDAGDPVPHLAVSKPVGPEGLQWDAGVSIDVPAGAVPAGHRFTVGIGRPIGDIDGSANETYGVPVHIEHDADLLAPVHLSWDVSHLTDEQRASILLVRWNPDVGVWAVADEVGVLTGTTLTAEVTRFSFFGWVSSGAASVGQTVGQLSGKRASAPSCSGNPLPGWVSNVVRPDEEQPAMPIRTCVEPDNDVLTVRVANNRPYTQVLELTGGDRYAWTWPGDPDYTASGIIRDSINKLLSDDTSLVMAPTRATAVGLARPATSGPVRMTLTARPSVAAVSTDILVYILENAVGLDNVAGFDSETLNAFVQAAYDCGGKQLLKSREPVGLDSLQKVLETVQSCVDSDAVRSAIENALRSQIAKGLPAEAKAIRTNRFLRQAMGKLDLYLTWSDFSSYAAELSSSGAVGDVSVSVFGTGAPQVLGSWDASCRDADADSDKLFRNLALQDAFKDASKEYWQFPTWQSNSATAAEPLAKCSAAHIEAVAANVEKTWGDQKAAAIVAQTVRALVAATPMTDQQLLNAELPANTCWTGSTGWNHTTPIRLRNGQGIAKAADGSFGGASVLKTEILGRADVDGNGTDEIVLSLQCTGSLPEHCCAGRSSIATTVGVFAAQGGKLTKVAPVLMGGASGPGDQYGPADRLISSAKLRGKTVVTTESIIYPEHYTSSQVGGNPARQFIVEYTLTHGAWTSSNR